MAMCVLKLALQIFAKTEKIETVNLLWFSVKCFLIVILDHNFTDISFILHLIPCWDFVFIKDIFNFVQTSISKYTLIELFLILLAMLRKTILF